MSVYVYQAAQFCDRCGSDLPQPSGEGPHDSDSVAIAYPDAGEGDTPAHCDRCGELLDCTLTDDGRAYVREAIAAADRDGRGEDSVIRQWRETFAL